MRRHLTSFLLLAALSGAATQALAQDATAPRVFEPEYFDVFQPQTASDMVRRLPGFSIQGDEGGARGFGQASLNLLINGRRPSSKSSSAQSILGRIPADNVIRIEIVDGATLDIPGLSGQVANIITKAAKISGSWEYAARFERDTEPQVREGQVSLSGERGNLAFVASLEADQFTFTERGTEQFFDGDGTLIEDRTERPYYAFNRPRANLNLTWTPQDSHVANLNLGGELLNRRSGVRETFRAVTDAGTTGASDFSGGEDEYNYEISGDYSFPALAGSVKLIGLYRFEESDFNSLFVNFPDDETPTRSIFDRIDDEIEKIARVEYSFKPAAKHDLQIAVEGAFNVLDSESVLSETSEVDSFDGVRVEEDRAETNVTHGWIISDRLNVQSSLGVEYSKLAVVSTNDPARKFWRPKGFVSASYDVSPTYTWRAKIERDVGQLNFGTFVSSVNLADEFTSTGNNQIVPTQSWQGELELERKDEAGLSGTLKLFANLIEDPIDRIRFTDGSEGPGNLDSALEYGIEANGTWLTDQAGLKGGRVTFSAGLADSSIDDPLTGLSRRINDTETIFYDVTFRHDIPDTNYAWYTNVEYDYLSPFFRLDQTFDRPRDRPEWRIGVEHKDFLGVRVRLDLQNILNWNVERERQIFSTDRLGELIQTERFSRNRGRRFGVTISDTF